MTTVKEAYDEYVEKKRSGKIKDPYEPQILSYDEYVKKYIHGCNW